jgi:hypothetical protein
MVMLDLLSIHQTGMEPYLVELIGGPYDGHIEPTDAVPLANSFKISAADSIVRKIRSPRLEVVYDWKETVARFVDGLPVLVFRYHYVGHRIAAQTQTWFQWLLENVRSRKPR